MIARAEIIDYATIAQRCVMRLISRAIAYSRSDRVIDRKGR